MATVTILGKLGKDVELKDINGKRLAKFSIADNVGWGENKQTMWYEISVWDGLAKTNFVDYLKKGQTVQVVGELSSREYNGKTYLEVKRVYECKLAGSNQQGGQTQQSQPQQSGGYSQQPQQAGSYGNNQNHRNNNDLDDDLPF